MYAPIDDNNTLTGQPNNNWQKLWNNHGTISNIASNIVPQTNNSASKNIVTKQTPVLSDMEGNNINTIISQFNEYNRNHFANRKSNAVPAINAYVTNPSAVPSTAPPVNPINNGTPLPSSHPSVNTQYLNNRKGMYFHKMMGANGSILDQNNTQANSLNEQFTLKNPFLKKEHFSNPFTYNCANDSSCGLSIQNYINANQSKFTGPIGPTGPAGVPGMPCSGDSACMAAVKSYVQSSVQNYIQSNGVTAQVAPITAPATTSTTPTTSTVATPPTTTS